MLKEAEVKDLERRVAKLRKKMKEKRAPGSDLFATAAAAYRGKRPAPEGSSSDDEETGRDAGFRDGLSRPDGGVIQRIALLSPGALFAQGLTEVTRYLGDRGGPASGGSALPAKM
eukprot:5043978-Lingulodinium_polyedra.AAC.1